MNKFFILILLGILLYIIVSIAKADQSIKLTCTPPTTREDGSELRPEEISHYHFCGSEVSNGACEKVSHEMETCELILPDANDLIGTFFQVKVVDIDNIPSDWSNEVQFLVNRPGTPTSLKFIFEWVPGG